jgi:type I restriction enzyme S subunit
MVRTQNQPCSGTPSWPLARLADLCEAIDYGYTASAKQFPCGPRFLRITDIVGGFVDWDSVPFCEIDSQTADRFRLHDGDIVLARTGASTGAAAFIAEPPDAVFASYLVRLRVVPSVDSRFLYYTLRTPQFADFIAGVVGDKSAQPNASAKTMTQITVRVPPLNEQKAIATFLAALDDKIELNRRMNKTLEEMARAIFKSWFVDFDPVRAKAAVRREHPRWTKEQVSRAACPNLRPDLAALFPDAFEDSDLGEIPRAWEVGTLGDVAENPRRSIQPDEINPATPYIALEHMPKRSVVLPHWGTGDAVVSNKCQFRVGEILFGKLRPYFHKVGVAPVNGVCSTDIVVVAPRSARWFGYVLGQMSSDAFVEYTNACSTGTKMPRTSWNDMSRYSVVMPSDAITEAFTNQVRPAVYRIVAGIQESRTLAALRETLLPKLMSGELRVPDAVKLAEASI